MAKFKVTITETLKLNVEVEAETMEDAIQKVTDAYHNEEYVLDADNYVDTDFEAAEIA